MRVYDACRLFARRSVEEGRGGNTVACLVHGAHFDAGGKNAWCVAAALEKSGLFERCHGAAHACVDIVRLVVAVPAGLPRYVEGRATHRVVSCGEVFDGFPDLLYLAD